MATASGINLNAAVNASSVALPHGVMALSVHVEAREPDGTLIGVYDNPFDLGTKALAQLIQTNILNTAATITDTTDTGRSVSVNSASTVQMIVAGTSNTAATFTDYALNSIASGGTYGGSNSSGNQAATVNAIASNTFTVTATITNISGSTISYAEVGMAVTVGGHTFLIAHDAPITGGPYTVSNAGTLAVTYTATFT
jgi:hypothetical protein